MLRIVVVVAGGFVGFCGPNFILDRMITKRQDRIRLSLPDALDLLVVSVEAGLGLDQAIQHVARELHGSHREISEELSLVNLEMRAGKRRSEALTQPGRAHRRAGAEETDRAFWFKTTGSAPAWPNPCGRTRTFCG